jgi:hypothetical protein
VSRASHRVGGGLVLRFIITATYRISIPHRERRCAGPARRATEVAGDTLCSLDEKTKSVPRVKKRNAAGARGLSPEGSAAEAKRMHRQTEEDDRAQRGVLEARRSWAQGVRQRAGGADRAAGAGRERGCLFCCDKRSPGCVGRARREACAAYCKYASALAPALARLATGLPCLATKPFRGQAPSSGARMQA